MKKPYIRRACLYMLLPLLLAGLMCLPLFSDVLPSSVTDVAACGSVAVAYTPQSDGQEAFSVSAGSAILMDADSGSILYAQNADMQRGMASTTKIMTALVVLETLAPETEVEITAEMVGVEGSSLYLQVGEHLTVLQLLYGLMLESGNDAAQALAIVCDGSIERFAERMNRKAAELGLTYTHFANPHGLSASGHYTTARELAMITREAMKDPLFRELVSTYQIRIPYKDQADARVLTNHNPILKQYEGLLGVKTGWTTADGKCFVTAAERDGLTVIAVTLGDSNISTSHRALLDFAFAQYEAVPLQVDTPLSVPLVGGLQSFLPICADGELSVCLPRGKRAEVHLELPPFVYAGTEKGQVIGRAVFVCDGNEVGSLPLVTAADAPVKRLSFWEKLFGK